MGLDCAEKVMKMFHFLFFFLFFFFLFRTHSQLMLCVLNVVSLALCSTTNVSDESRKTSARSASASVGSSAHLNSLNSLQSSQDNGGKPQSVQQQSNTGLPAFTRIPTPEYTSITQPHTGAYTASQPHSGAYPSTQPTSPSGGGYFISVNPQAAIGPGDRLKLLLTAQSWFLLFNVFFSRSIGPTPVIMQYLPHNAQQGPIQYLQLIPTRPLIVPISPYLPSNFNNPYTSNPSAQASSTSPYTLPHTLPHTLAHHSYPPASPSSPPSNAYGSNSYGSGSYGSGSFGNSYSAPSLQNPIGGYSSNYLTYSLRPNHGMQLVNGPLDLSLNTNEYIPIQNENTYKMRRA